VVRPARRGRSCNRLHHSLRLDGIHLEHRVVTPACWTGSQPWDQCTATLVTPSGRCAGREFGCWHLSSQVRRHRARSVIVLDVRNG
jgi:hypothetical protein